MTFVLTTIDTNRSQSDLAHLEGQSLHRHRARTAEQGRTIINELLQHIGDHHRRLLLSVDIDNPSADDDELLDQILAHLTPEQVAILDDAFTDTLVVADPYASGMTRYDLPERTEGTITTDSDPSGILDPLPGEDGSEYRSYKHWAIDQISTILTGIDPVHGEVPVFKSRLINLLKEARFRKVVRSTGLKLIDLYRAVDALPDHPVEDHEQRFHPIRSSRSSYSNLYPPPHPDDETPPDAVRPRPNNFQRGISMDQDTLDPYTEARHQATDLVRQAVAATNPAVRAALMQAARKLSRSISSYEEDRHAFAAVSTRFTRRRRRRNAR